jgi:hypothetical protein
MITNNNDRPMSFIAKKTPLSELHRKLPKLARDRLNMPATGKTRRRHKNQVEKLLKNQIEQLLDLCQRLVGARWTLLEKTKKSSHYKNSNN